MTAGLTGVNKENGDYSLSSRFVGRYTFSKELHLEVVGDIGLKSENIPLGIAVGFQVRYNF